MNRLWLGCIILLALLGLVFGIQLGMQRIHLPIQQQLTLAEDAALSGDWDTARQLAEKARKRWETYHSLIAAVADHSPMDQLDMLFGEIRVYCREKTLPEFAAACDSAARMARAMADAQVLTWWNFL